VPDLRPFYEILWLLIALAVVGFLAYYSSKYLSKKSGSLLRGKYLNVIDRVVISNEKYIMLLKAGEKVIIVGVTNQNMAVLGELDKDQIVDFDKLDVQEQTPTFVNALSSLIVKGFNKIKQNKTKKTSFSEWRDFFDKKGK